MVVGVADGSWLFRPRLRQFVLFKQFIASYEFRVNFQQGLTSPYQRRSAHC